MDFCCVYFVILVISFRRITSVPTETPTGNNTTVELVEEISINGKQLSEIPQGTASVKTLDLAYNNLFSLPPNVFQNKSYKDVTILDFHENRISNVSFLAFRGLRRLKNVDLSFNKIVDLDPYTFEQNRRIEKLDLTRNKIKFTKSKVFLVSPSMQTLVLAKNNIDQLYELTFVGLKHLTNLILDDNTLGNIHPNAFKPLTDIQFLSMSNSRVIHLGSSMFAQIPRVINVESTPLADKFDPPLKRIKMDQVTTLLKADDY